MTGTREHLCEACPNALPHGIGVGEDDNAAFLVRGADVLDRRAAQAKAICDDAVRLDRTPHRPHIHLPLDNDDFFNHNRLLRSLLS